MEGVRCLDGLKVPAWTYHEVAVKDVFERGYCTLYRYIYIVPGCTGPLARRFVCTLKAGAVREPKPMAISHTTASFFQRTKPQNEINGGRFFLDVLDIV